MQATKVSVSSQTLDLNRVGKRKKTDLRRKLIIELIQSKPAGEYIKMSEFQKVGQFAGTGNTHMFVHRMIRDGVISQYDGDKPKSHYYGVTGAVRVKKPVADVVREEPEAVVGGGVGRTHSAPTLAEYAKQFAWERNSDSLRDFVAYMDGKELELRRAADVK